MFAHDIHFEFRGGLSEFQKLNYYLFGQIMGVNIDLDAV